MRGRELLLVLTERRSQLLRRLQAPSSPRSSLSLLLLLLWLVLPAATAAKHSSSALLHSRLSSDEAKNEPKKRHIIKLVSGHAAADPAAVDDDQQVAGDNEYDIDVSDQEGYLKRANSDGTTKWSWPTFSFTNMTEDIADRLDDLICALDKVMGTDIETLIFILLGWLVFGGIIFILSHLIYNSLGSDYESSYKNINIKEVKDLCSTKPGSDAVDSLAQSRSDEIPEVPLVVKKESLAAVPPESKTQNSTLQKRDYQDTSVVRKSGRDSKVRPLEVKVVKVTQLGVKSGNNVEPYVIIEIDEPNLRCQTRAGTGPQTEWNEVFTLNVNDQSKEILFEVWDQGQKIGKSDTFLGLGIVGVSELLITASQRHVIPLQGRPFQNDEVNGLLTIEFLFKDSGISFSETDRLNGIYRTFETKQITNGDNTIYNEKTVYSLNDPLTVGEELASLKYNSTAANSSRGEQLEAEREATSVSLVQRRSFLRDTSGRDGPGKRNIHSVAEIALKPEENLSSPSSETGEYSAVGLESSAEDQSEKSRGRKSKRNIFSKIKQRFPGSRSLSVYQNKNKTNNDDSSERGMSLDRLRSASENRSGNLSSSNINSRTAEENENSFLTIPGFQSEDASSMSDVSGISSASNKTYITDESSLVLETIENGRRHHYLIPAKVSRERYLKKKGLKLHIYLDHIFIARHIKLGTVCHACNRIIPMRLGKQAYVCRDCGITTHKRCHIKVESHCLHTSLPSMELEYYNEEQ